MILLSGEDPTFKFMILHPYICIQILDLKLENSYATGPKDPKWHENKRE